MRRPWTPEEDALLRANYGRTDLTLRMMHLLFEGRTPASVHRRVAILGLTKARYVDWTADEDMQFRVLWNDGLPVPAICDALGKSDSQVRTRRRVLGLTARKGERWVQAAMRARDARAATPMCRACEILMEYADGCPRRGCPRYDAGNHEREGRTLAGVVSYG